jgi:hypothetical protein
MVEHESLKNEQETTLTAHDEKLVSIWEREVTRRE